MQDIVLLQPLFNFWQSARLYCARRRPQEGGEHTWRPILPLFFLTTPARPLHHPCENLLVQFPPGKMINVTTTPTAEGETPPVRSGRKAKKTPFVRSLLLSFAPPPEPHPSLGRFAVTRHRVAVNPLRFLELETPQPKSKEGDGSIFRRRKSTNIWAIPPPPLSSRKEK